MILRACVGLGLALPLAGCAPSPSPLVDVAAWTRAGEAIDSLASLDRIDDALDLAQQRLGTARAARQPAWMLAEARDTEAALKARAKMTEAHRLALASADREYRIADLKAGTDSVATARRLVRAVLDTRTGLLGRGDIRTAKAALQMARLEAAVAHVGEADSLARMASEVFLARLGSRHPSYADAEELRGRLIKDFSGQIASAEALVHYRRALEIRMANEGPNSLAVAECEHDLGNLDRLRQDPIAAAGHFRRAIEIRRALLGPINDRVAAVYGAMAFMSAGQGRWVEAESLAREAVAATPTGPDAPSSGRSIRLSLRGQALRHLGRNAEAEPLLRQAVAVRESLWAQAAQDEGGTITAGLSLYRDLALTVAAQGRGDEAFALVERGSARVLETRMPKTEGDGADSWHNLLARVQRTLAPDEALVSWPRSAGTLFVADYPMYAWIVRPSGPVRWVRLDQRAPTFPGIGTIREALWRELLADGNWPRRITDTTTVGGLSQLMWRERFAPLESELRGARHLIVCSTDFMAGGALGVLQDAQGHYLADRYTISYAPSALVLARLRERRGTGRDAPLWSQPALLVGDPAFANSGNEHWARLPSSGEEVRKLAALLPLATVMTGNEASAGRLRELADRDALRQFRLMHFATHTVANETRVLGSSMLLAPDALGRPSSRLNSREIMDHWRLGADVVSLAGCHSIAGMSSETEGAMGLQQAFLVAGARSLVVTLWAVDDHATSLVMEGFVRHMTDREHPLDAANALRSAQLELRDWRARDGSRPYAHPVYWGAFVLVGDAGARRGGARS